MKRLACFASIALSALLLTGCSISPEESSYTAPRFIGAGLKSAEKEIDKRSFSKGSLTATDATGQRRQIEISNDWKICGQSIAPGSKIASNSVIRFNVVAANEVCTTSADGAPSGAKKDLRDYIEAEKYFVAKKDTKYNGLNVNEFQAKQIEYKYYRYFDNATRVVIPSPSLDYTVCFIDVVKDKEEFAMVSVSKGSCTG